MRSRRLASLLALSALAACGPLGPLAGGRLTGEVVSDPVTDWSFTDALATVEVETRPEAPYSVTVWCFHSGSSLYVPARNPKSKTWVQNALADDRVRLRIDGRIYERRAVRVTDPDEIEAVLPALLEKYQLELPDPGRRPEVDFFRLEPRVEARSAAGATDAEPGG